MKKIYTFILALSFSVAAVAQLVINEFMASNSTAFADEYGEYEDWIEIYNTSDTEVDLTDYYLTDKYDNPTKFEFAESGTIPAHEYLVIFADEDGNQGVNHANFKLDREGEKIAIVKISGSDTLFIDSLSYPVQLTDISWGRFPDAGTTWEFFSEPTPGSSNVSANLEGIAPSPVFSQPGGFYSGSQNIELSSPITGAEIRYTVDGSLPDLSSDLYVSPISSDTNIIIKARIYAPDYLPGPILSQTFFIDEYFIPFSLNDRLPVVSVSAEPDLLWSPESGLLNDDNQSNTWELAANVELFEPDGTEVINQLAGIKLFGHSTRSMAQKSIAVIARNEYGLNRFDYKLFNDRPFEEYKSFVLRNGGNDWSETYFRDALCQGIVRNNMDIDAQSSKQAVVFVNGHFYGVTCIMEKVNEHYLEAHHSIDPDNFDMLQDEGLEAIYGNEEAYNAFRGFVVRNDMGMNILYDQLGHMMDLKEYMNLYIAQIYLANIDMALNQKYYCEKENYGKWRWIIYDTEISFGQGDYSYTTFYGTIPSSNTLDFATIDDGFLNWPYLRPWSSEKIISMLDNDEFRNEFIQTFAVHLNTTFKPSRVRSMIDSMAQNFRSHMPRQIQEYGGVVVGFNPYGNHFTTMEEWEFYVDSMENFARLRVDYMRSFILNRFSLEGTYELTLSTNNPAEGSFFVQDIQVPVDSAGIYFDDVPLHIKAVPGEGFRFIRWAGASISDSLSAGIVLQRSEDLTLEAIFEPEGDLTITEIYYNPVLSDTLEFIELYNPKHSTGIDLTDFSISGDIAFTFPAGSFIGPEGYLVVAADISSLQGMDIRTIQWTSGTLGDSEGVIKILDNNLTVLDSVAYFNELPWPGPGNSLPIELTDIYCDNNTGENWIASSFFSGTPGSPFRTEGIPSLLINEFQADNANFTADEYNQYNDWIEIVNTGTQSVDLGGLFMTNDLDNPGRYQIPTNAHEVTTIIPGEHKLIWADRDSSQGPLHLGFNLNKGGCAFGISTDGKTFIDSVSYSQQMSENFSCGRYPDISDTWRDFERPTPAYKNSLPPVFLSQPLLEVEKRTDYEYDIQVSDPENDELILGVEVLPQWLYYFDNPFNPNISGRSPVSTFEPVRVKLFVTDGYTGLVTQEFQITQAVPESIESITAGSFRIYPNPAREYIYVEAGTESSEIVVSILTLQGQIVRREKLTGSDSSVRGQVDLSGLKKGLYLVSVQTDSGSTTQKIILL